MSIGRVMSARRGCPLVADAADGARGHCRSTHPGKRQPFIYEPFTLRLEVECDAPPETPELPTVPDLTVTTVRRLPADPAQRKYAFQIEMIAERDGILTVPPFAVRVRGETALTSALRLRISAPRSATEMTLEVTVEPTTLRVGQPATLTVTWSSGVPFAHVQAASFRNPASGRRAVPRLSTRSPPGPESEGVGLPVNNIRMVAQAGTLAWRTAISLVPLHVGSARAVRVAYAARPARLRPAGRKNVRRIGRRAISTTTFFETAGDSDAFEEVYLTAPVPEITVRALAETGRNAHFAEIVGSVRPPHRRCPYPDDRGATRTIHGAFGQPCASHATSPACRRRHSMACVRSSIFPESRSGKTPRTMPVHSHTFSVHCVLGLRTSPRL